MPVGIELGQPAWLLALPSVALLLVATRWPWWLAARRAGHAAQRREGWRLGLRLAWTLLLVLALAEAVLVRPLHRQAIVFALDASASMAPVRDQLEATVRTSAPRREPGDLVGVVAVGAGSHVEEAPGPEPRFTRLGVGQPDGASDLASGLRLAGALVPSGYTARVVLASDGRQTRGDAVAAARELAARGISVDVLPLGAASGPDVRLDAVDVPEIAASGEVSTLVARLSAAQPTTALLRIVRDDQLVVERPVQLRAGSQEIAFPIPVGGPGLHRYRIDLAADPSADAIAANNVLGAVQRVVGPPRVLIVAGAPSAPGLLPSALQAVGADVVVVEPAGVPADLAGWARYDLVVLADVAAMNLPPGAMELLERSVQELGRGLVMSGGLDSFGPGGYADTPIERALPVWMDVRGRGRQPHVAMVLIVDKSGSMGGLKIEMAKEAAARSVRLLRDEDRAAVLAFDSVPQWVMPLTPMAERARIETGIGGIFADGGTDIYPALATGFAALRDEPADVKHIILLTDGRSGSAGDYLALLQELREARVTLSTVGVGDDADNALLDVMARLARGRFHFAGDPASIPQIFTRETVMATRALLVDATFAPAAASAGPLLRGVTTVAPLNGYVATTAKDRAEVVLVSPEGDPVLAAWQYGAGRAIAWTPDLAGRWSSAWSGSPAATALWGNVLSWLLPPEQDGELAVSMEADGEGGVVILAENRSAWSEVRPTHASLFGPTGGRQDLELAPASPGRYRARVPAPETGAYLAFVTQTTPDGEELRAEGGWAAPYPAEFREVGVDQALLTQIAAAGAGRVLTDPAAAVRPAERPAVVRWPLAPLLLVLAALFWPLEIASRRLILAVPAAVRQRALQFARPSGRAAGSSSTAEVAPSLPAAATTQRLLERKRALQQRRR